MKIIVLGGGLVGAPMAMDLAKDLNYSVSVADISEPALNRVKRHEGIKTIRQDLTHIEDLKQLVSDYDMVINAVPGFMGFKTLETIIEAEKNVVDIAFFPEDPLALDDLAKRKGVVAIVDCGVAPGMSHILTSHAYHQLHETETAVIYVGGLPVVREWPYEYKAVFSPLDVIEEYIRPAYFVENGKLESRPALSDPEYINFPPIGTLEAFNTDGLRTLVKTMNIPNMKEKTMRYPGHIEKIALLKETGFFSRDEIEVNGVKIRPVDFTARLLFPKWQLKEGEMDITVMRVTVKGKKDKYNVEYIYDLFDKYDDKTKIHSMARTTGYTATMTARMVEKGLYDHHGVSPPEYIGKHPNCVDFLLNGLKDRGVEYRETIRRID